MIVIIEGLDGVGKTTLVNRLIKDTKVPFISVHEGYPGEEPGIRLERFRQLKENVDTSKGGRLIYYDRCTCIDDFVYNILNKTTSELTDKIDEIKKVLKKCLIIHVELDKETHLKRFNDRGDEFIKSDQFDELNKSYEEFYKGLNIHKVQLTDNLDEDIKTIEMIVDEECAYED